MVNSQFVRLTMRQTMIGPLRIELLITVRTSGNGCGTCPSSQRLPFSCGGQLTTVWLPTPIS
ncbi:hypothetical protein LINPERPRIM_LOCUS13479 [Linum perenne]